MSVDKTTVYYLIVTATFLLNIAFIPLLFEVLQHRNMSNIPYLTLGCILAAQALFLCVVLLRSYYYHVFIYLIGFICVSALLFLKSGMDNQNTQVINKNIYNKFIVDEELS